MIKPVTAIAAMLLVEGKLIRDRTGDFWWLGYFGTTFFAGPCTGLVGVVLSQNEPGEFSGLPLQPHSSVALTSKSNSSFLMRAPCNPFIIGQCAAADPSQSMPAYSADLVAHGMLTIRAKSLSLESPGGRNAGWAAGHRELRLSFLMQVLYLAGFSAVKNVDSGKGIFGTPR